MSKVAISAEVACVLGRAMIDGLVLRLGDEQLPRPLYAATDKVLTALGGKWDRRSRGHIFPSDPAQRLADALDIGSAFDEGKARIKELQFFETPASLAARMADAIGVTPQDRCLEPSAGRGAIVAALAARSPSMLTAVEIDGDNGEALKKQGLASSLIVGDFFDFCPANDLYTAIAMNPPFRGNQDVRHIRRAFTMLAGGGRLVAIASEHSFFGQEREAVEWRGWLAAIDADVETIPAGTFKESGTNIATRLIVARRAA